MSVYSGPNAIQSGLVLHIDPSNPRSYPGAGSTVFDLTSNRNNGVMTNGATVIQSGPNRVLSFDGVNDYTEFSTNLPLAGLSRLSLSAWFFASSNTVPVFFLARYSSGLGANARSDYFAVQPISNILYPQCSFAVAGNNNAYQYFDISTPTLINRWNFVCFCIDLSAGVGQISVNETIVAATRTVAGTPPTSFASNTVIPYTINRYTSLTGTQFYGGGIISDLRVYSSFLSRADVIQNYHATKGRYGL